MEERIRYVFRMPRFPLLLDTGTELIALHCADECEARLPLLGLTGDPRPVIDAKAEGFAFYPDLQAITPLTLKKDWTKAGIVALYVARQRPGAPMYTRSLPNRKLADVVAGIVGSRDGGLSRNPRLTIRDAPSRPTSMGFRFGLSLAPSSMLSNVQRLAPASHLTPCAQALHHGIVQAWALDRLHSPAVSC